MSLLTDITGWINEQGTSAILRERLALLRDQLQDRDHRIQTLQAAMQQLERESADLRRQLQQQTVPEDLVEHRGALFRKRPGGQVQEDALCLRCRTPMYSVGGATPFKCGSCGYIVGFTGRELHGVLAQVSTQP